MLILDTQLLVLLVVGLTSRSIIEKHRNLQAYTVADYDLLREMLGDDPGLLLLPNIVTEASNLLRQHKNPERQRIMLTLRELLAQCQERYDESVIASAQEDYLRLGITDTAILISAASGTRLLTADAGLFIAAEIRGFSAVNFNHHREESGP